MSQDDKPYAQPTTKQQRHRQSILMYVRDEVISPIMPPVKKYDRATDTWLKSRDHTLIDKLSEKHTDALLRLISADNHNNGGQE